MTTSVTADATPTPSVDDEARRTLEERARALAAPVRTHEVATELHLAVRLGGHRLAIPAASARHVGPTPPLTAVPAAPAAIVGVAPVLGEIVVVADLAAVLGADAERPYEEGQLLVVDDADGGLGLLVDGVEGLMAIDAGEEASDPTAADERSPHRALTRSTGDGTVVLRLHALLGDARLSSPDSSTAPPIPGAP
jgi:chemotaxis signal transduction protein